MWASQSEELPDGFRDNIYSRLKDHGKNPRLLKSLGGAGASSLASLASMGGSSDGDYDNNGGGDDDDDDTSSIGGGGGGGDGDGDDGMLGAFPVTQEDVAYEQGESAEVAKAIAANRALREQLAIAEGRSEAEANPLTWGEEQVQVMRRVKVGRKSRMRPIKKVETNVSRKMCRHETYEEDKEKMMRPKILERRMKSTQYDKANKKQAARLQNVGYNVNSAVGIVTSGYGVEPPAGMDEKYYAEKKRRHKEWIKTRFNPEWTDRDPDTLHR